MIKIHFQILHNHFTYSNVTLSIEKVNAKQKENENKLTQHKYIIKFLINAFYFLRSNRIILCVMFFLIGEGQAQSIPGSLQ